MEKCEILSRLILMIEDVDGPLGFKPAHFFLFERKPRGLYMLRLEIMN